MEVRAEMIAGEWGDWDWCDGGTVSGCVGWKTNAR